LNAIVNEVDEMSPFVFSIRDAYLLEIEKDAPKYEWCKCGAKQK